MNPHPPLLTSLRMLPRPAWIIFIGTFLNKFGTFVIPFLTLYLTSRGYTVTDAGVAIGAYGFGSLLDSLLGGYLADRLGRRQTIVLSMFLGAATMMALSQARCLPLIIALTALTGLASEFYRPASNALLADLVPPNQRVTAFATLRMAFNAGFAFGPATAGLLALSVISGCSSAMPPRHSSMASSPGWPCPRKPGRDQTTPVGAKPGACSGTIANCTRCSPPTSASA